jgi:hypothetical protein
MKEAVHTLTNDGGTGIPLGTEKQRPRWTLDQMLQERTPSKEETPNDHALTGKGMIGKRKASGTLNGTYREPA